MNLQTGESETVGAKALARRYRIVYEVPPMDDCGRRQVWGPPRADYPYIVHNPARVTESVVLEAYDDIEAVRRLEYRLIKEGCCTSHFNRDTMTTAHTVIYQVVDIAPAD